MEIKISQEDYIGYMQVQFFYKGLEHWLVLISAGGPGINPPDTKGRLYL